MDIKINGLNLKADYITVLYGHGKWLDNYDGEVYEIDTIKLPTLPSGKHITIHSKDMEGVVENRSYDDGKILEFVCEKVEHWNF